MKLRNKIILICLGVILLIGVIVFGYFLIRRKSNFWQETGNFEYLGKRYSKKTNVGVTSGNHVNMGNFDITYYNNGYLYSQIFSKPGKVYCIKMFEKNNWYDSSYGILFNGKTAGIAGRNIEIENFIKRFGQYMKIDDEEAYYLFNTGYNNFYNPYKIENVAVYTNSALNSNNYILDGVIFYGEKINLNNNGPNSSPKESKKKWTPQANFWQETGNFEYLGKRYSKKTNVGVTSGNHVNMGHLRQTHLSSITLCYNQYEFQKNKHIISLVLGEYTESNWHWGEMDYDGHFITIEEIKPLSNKYDFIFNFIDKYGQPLLNEETGDIILTLFGFINGLHSDPYKIKDVAVYTNLNLNANLYTLDGLIFYG